MQSVSVLGGGVLDPEQTVKDFISAVQALEKRPIADFTQEDVDEAWEIWGNLARWIQGGGFKPANLMEGRRWAARLEKLEKKLIKLY